MQKEKKKKMRKERKEKKKKREIGERMEREWLSIKSRDSKMKEKEETLALV